ncbi:hypothetical protein ACWDBW_06760 [Streptomyces sp. NPDC001107]
MACAAPLRSDATAVAGTDPRIEGTWASAVIAVCPQVPSRPLAAFPVGAAAATTAPASPPRTVGAGQSLDQRYSPVEVADYRFER